MNGTMTDSIVINGDATVTMNKFLNVAHSAGNLIQAAPQSATNLMQMTAATSSSYNELSLNGATDSASVFSLSETAKFGSTGYKGVRMGYAGSTSWQSAFGAPSVESFFLQTGNSTDGYKNIMSVSAQSGNTKSVFHGEVELSGVEYDVNPTLSFVNDKGGSDMQIFTNDSTGYGFIDCNLAGLTINTSTAALSQLKLDSTNIILDANQNVRIFDNGTDIYGLPNASDPATDGYILTAKGVGSTLSFEDSINISSIIGTTVSATNGSITYLGSTTVTTQHIDASDQIDLNVSGSGVPTWAAYGNINNISGVVLQQKGSNPFVAEDIRSGYWLVARDSNAANAPATPSNVAWCVTATDASYTMQNLAFRRTENAGTNTSIVGYLDSQTAAGLIDFTGQHRSVVSPSAPSGMETLTGFIVVSDGTYSNLSGGTTRPEINEALPRVTLSDRINQKSVYGVISSTEDDQESTRTYSSGAFTTVLDKVDNRLIINSLGEGGIWVANTNGNLENGDLITTSFIPGVGARQSDDAMRSYTVAKITQDCDFDLNSEAYLCVEVTHEDQVYRRAFVGCTYHCG